MKLFIWNCVEAVTENYHNEGGLVIIAESLERAREMMRTVKYPRYPGDPKMAEFRDGVPEECGAHKQEPDLVRDCEGPEYLVVHRDAGCC